MRKQGGTPSWRDKHVMLASISPPSDARGRLVGGHQSGLAGCKPPPLFKRGASSCSSQGQRQRKLWGACPRPSASTYLPTSIGITRRQRWSHESGATTEICQDGPRFPRTRAQGPHGSFQGHTKSISRTRVLSSKAAPAPP